MDQLDLRALMDQLDLKVKRDQGASMELTDLRACKVMMVLQGQLVKVA